MSERLSLIPILLILGLMGGCAAPDTGPMSREQSSAAPYSPPLPVLTPDQEKEKEDARQAYAACLNSAAHYADQGAMAIDNVAGLIAPMCYPQFSRLEIASAAGLGTRDRRAYDHDGDKRQLEFAGDVIRRERSVAALATGQ